MAELKVCKRKGGMRVAGIPLHINIAVAAALALMLCGCTQAPEVPGGGCADGGWPFVFSEGRCVGNAGQQTYTLTVSHNPLDGGSTNPASSRSNISAGSQVNISATASPGYMFSNWTITPGSGNGSITNASSSSATVTVNGDVTVTANFTQSGTPPDTTKPKFQVTLTTAGTGAIGNGSYAEGATVAIDAGTPPAGQRFKNWTTQSSGVTFANPNNSVTTFKMPANAVAVTAYFEEIPKYTVEYDGNGNRAGTAPTDGNSPYQGGAEVTVRVPGDLAKTGYNFSGWNTSADGSGTDYGAGETFIIQQNTTLYAKWTSTFVTTYLVTVTGGTGGGQKAAGDTVTVAATVPAGQTFSKWTTATAGVKFADSTGATTKFVMPASAVTVTANFTQSVTPPSGESGTLTDVRDGKTYKTAKMPDGKWWMAQNLNYHKVGVTDSSWCYSNSADSCTKYGRLYNWSTAMNGASNSTSNPSKVQGVCPEKWHLPSWVEWNALVSAVGSSAGTKLKSESGWFDTSGNPSGNGTDIFDFSALPGGYRYSDGGFYLVGYHGVWWSATELAGGATAISRLMRYNIDDVHTGGDGKSYGESVRCVGDD